MREALQSIRGLILFASFLVASHSLAQEMDLILRWGSVVDSELSIKELKTGCVRPSLTYPVFI
jgi:hypothetical protein